MFSVNIIVFSQLIFIFCVSKTNGLPLEQDIWAQIDENDVLEPQIAKHDQYATMLKYMDKSADPCNDFYQYACGNWENQHAIPVDLPSYDIFAILNLRLEESLLNILNGSSKNETVHTSDAASSAEAFDMEQQVNIFFSTCSDMQLINRRGAEPLFDLLKKLGGFPLLDGDKWSADTYDLEEVLALQSIYQMKSFFSTGIEYDLKDIEKSVLYIVQPELGLRSNADYLEEYNRYHLQGYRDFIAEILTILEAPQEQIAAVVDDIIELETKLANYTEVRAHNYEVHEMYDAKTLGALKEKYPKFDWSKYLKRIFDREFVDDYKIVLFGAPRTDEIYDLLVNTDKRIIANYINWHSIQLMLDFLDERFRAPKEKLVKILTGSERTEKKREQLCAKEINQAVGMAVSAMYVKKYFNEDSKHDVSHLTQELSNVFRQNLFTYDWIDDETKNLAETKVNRTKLAVGYPDFILNKTALNIYYKGLNFQRGKHFENMLNLKEFESLKEARKIDTKVDKTEWPIRPTIVNAFFEQPQNRIIMPAAILQPPIYHGSFPKSLNYGAIGVFIGHELTHGFDTIGRGFDHNGNMNNWWTNKSYEQFKNRTQCFVDQYSQFKIYNKTLNGRITKEENIADNGGMRLAFKVYTNWLSKASEDEKRKESLPELNLSPQQVFFIAFAQSWCEYIRPQAIENRLETDSHPPGKFRIIGTLQNFEEFSKAYQCPADSVMNPAKKCKLW